jgi:hypothetical protein
VSVNERRRDRGVQFSADSGATRDRPSAGERFYPVAKTGESGSLRAIGFADSVFWMEFLPFRKALIFISWRNFTIRISFLRAAAEWVRCRCQLVLVGRIVLVDSRSPFVEASGFLGAVSFVSGRATRVC